MGFLVIVGSLPIPLRLKKIAESSPMNELKKIKKGLGIPKKITRPSLTTVSGGRVKKANG